MAEVETAVEVSDLTVGYGNIVIQQDISFTVSKGEILAILGGSGCGKSTLLKHMIGLYKPMRGDVLIFGDSIVNAEEKKQREIMRGFGVTYQGGALFGSQTLAENVALPLEEYSGLSKKEIAVKVKEKLALVGLNGYENYLPAEISGGMKKRAGLARAMALDPELLFFDEPSAGLDPISSADLDKLILNLRDQFGTTIVVVTHELDSIFAIADQVIMLDRKTKTIAATGNPQALRENPPNEWVADFLNRRGMKRIEPINQE